MNREETRKLLKKNAELQKTQQAFADGAVVQFKHFDEDDWVDECNPIWNDRCLYRIKPRTEKRLRPYNAEELNKLVLTIVIHKLLNRPVAITAGCPNNCGSSPYVAIPFGTVNAVTLLNDYTHQDGSPCGVEETV